MHPTDSTWREMLDGEVNRLVLEQLDRHLLGCTECARQVSALQQDRDSVSGLLDVLDGSVPVGNVDLVLRRARRPTSHRWALIAAAIAVCVVTAAGAAIRTGGIRHLLERIRVHHPSPVVGGRPTPVLRADSAGPNSIGIEPKGNVEIVFLEIQPQGEIVVILGDAPILSITASAPVGYVIGTGQVTIANQGARSSYRVTVPRSAAGVSIRIADRVVFTKSGPVITTTAATDSSGTYLVSFTQEERNSP